MIQLHCFTFNPFQENTYILTDDSLECIIIDPGCSSASEFEELKGFIQQNDLKPKMVLNTHCHIDHILGNKVVCDFFDVELMIPEGESGLLSMGERIAHTYGLPYDPSPEPSRFLKEGIDFEFGNSRLTVISCPGHSPDHVVLYDEAGKLAVGGDVLFRGSIGRTDLPGGDHDTLIRNIKEKMFKLEDDVVVYPGHGPETTIGYERSSNPFLT